MSKNKRAQTVANGDIGLRSDVGRNWIGWSCRAIFIAMATRFLWLPNCAESMGTNSSKQCAMLECRVRNTDVSKGIGLTPCLIIVKGRLPVTTSNALQPNDLQFLKHLSFWLFELGNVSQSFAFFIPALWIPSFALTIGLPSYSGPLGLALINLAACFGAVIIGMYLLWSRFSWTRLKNICLQVY